MSSSDLKPERLFSVDDANKRLPLVRAIVRDLSKLSLTVQERRQRLSQIAGERDGEEALSNPYTEETEQIKQQLESDILELERFESELSDLGVACKHGPDGIVDFPSEMDGRLVYLCWKLGEPEVLYWHEVDSGYQDRHPLTAGMAASDSLIDGESVDN